MSLPQRNKSRLAYYFTRCVSLAILVPIQVCSSSSLNLGSLRPLTAVDTALDENREIVVKDNYTLAIIRHFLNPDIVHVAIPVIYNICMDYGEHFVPVPHFMYKNC